MLGAHAELATGDVEMPSMVHALKGLTVQLGEGKEQMKYSHMQATQTW